MLAKADQVSRTYFTLPPTVFAAAPSPTFSPVYELAGYVDPFADGSVLDCHLHRAPPVQLGSSITDSYKCSDFASFYGISMDQLVEWNPSLAARLVGGDCRLWPGEQYCARRDLDETADMTEACVETQVAETGTRSTCDGFVFWYNINKADFLAWHPGLGPQCENFHSGGFLSIYFGPSFPRPGQRTELTWQLKGYTYCTRILHFKPAGRQQFLVETSQANWVILMQSSHFHLVDTIPTCSQWHMATDVDRQFIPSFSRSLRRDGTRTC